MSGQAADGVARGLFAAVWTGVSSLLWSPLFVKTVSAVLALFPSMGTRRVAYKGTYMYATSVDRWVALLLWKHGILEGYELQVARSLIRPGMHILDVGSNVGFHSLEFARWTGPSGKVDAFEPAPENYLVLQRNVEASGLDNVSTFEIAVSDPAARRRYTCHRRIAATIGSWRRPNRARRFPCERRRWRSHMGRPDNVSISSRLMCRVPSISCLLGCDRCFGTTLTSWSWWSSRLSWLPAPGIRLRNSSPW